MKPGKAALMPPAGGFGREYGMMIRPTGSAAGADSRDIGLRIGRQSLEGRTERRAVADRNGVEARARSRKKRLATSPLRC